MRPALLWRFVAALTCWAASIIVLAGGHATWAQEGETVEERLQRLEEQNAALLQQIQALQEQLQQLQAVGAAPVETIPQEEEAPSGGESLPNIEELLEVQPAATQQAGAIGEAGGDPALNPLISFTFDYVANALDTQPALYDADLRQRHRVMGLRAVELNAKRGVSAYGDGFITWGDHGHGAELEEAYMDLNRTWDRFNVRLGRWRIPFGPYNGVHEHQVPCVTYPRTISSFFGFHGATGDGLEVTYLPKTRDYTELRLGGYRGIGSEVATAFTPSEDQDGDFSYSARLRYNRQPSPETDVDFTTTYLNGPNPDGPSTRSDLLSLALQWRRDRGNQHTDRIIADWVGYRREMGLAKLKRHAWSLMYLKQLGLYGEWGALYEDAAFGDPGITGRVRALSAFYTYKAQETQWHRLMYRHSSYPTGPDTDELVLQSLWSIGSHSHEFN
jgi:hypothetical protein